MTDKAKHVLSYIFPFVGLIFMFLKESSKEVKMVGAQATTLWLSYIVLTMAYGFVRRIIPIPFFSSLIGVAYLVFVIIGIVKVCNEQDLELPVIGGLSKAIFGKVIEK